MKNFIRLNLVFFILIIASLILAACFESDVRNKYTGSLKFNGFVRTYNIHFPPSYNEQNPAPLVFVFHGLGGDAKSMQAGTRLNDFADKRGFIVVYPDGFKKSWSDGGGFTDADKAGVDDVGFVSLLIDKLSKQLNIDPTKIYAVGFSNGGMFVYRLGCELSNKIAAITSIAGAIPENVSLKCNPQANVSVMHIHGTKDPVVPWEGGKIRFPQEVEWKILSIQSSVKKWAKINECTSFSRKSYEIYGGVKIISDKYDKCKNHTEVVLYGIVGGEHTFQNVIEKKESSQVTYTEDSILEFFEQHPKK